MEAIHSLLRRQLKRCFGEQFEIHAEWEAFIADIDRAYKGFDDDRETLERSLELSSQELLEANSEMRAIFQTIPDLLFRLDGGGIILDFKAGGKNDFLMEPAKLVGKRIQDVPSVHVGALFRNAIENVGKTHAVVSFEYSLTTHEELVPYEARVLPFFNDQLIVLIRNIADRKRAEEALRQSEAHLRALFEAMTDLVMIVDANGTFLEIAPTNPSLLFRPASEILGKNLTDIFPPAKARYFQDRIAQALQTRQPVSFEYNLRIEHTTRWFTATLSPLSPESALFIGRDISESKHIEQERKALESQLVQAQKMEAIGTLAAGIAHDFNNILAIILGYSARLQAKSVPHEKVKETCAVIDNAVERGAGLVRQILTFARKTEVVYGLVDPNVMIKEIVHMLRQTFPRVIVFNLELDPDIPSIVVDATQLHQAVLNLCINARDAMPEGGTLTIQTEIVPRDVLRQTCPDASEASYLALHVRDTGIGMNEETKNRIFEPFFTTKERGKGTGLGLAVVYGVVKSHEGYLHVTSAPRQGSMFSLYFPVPQGRSDFDQGKEAHVQLAPGGSETILVAEDEEELAGLITELLISKGYTVLLARNGEEAITLFAQHAQEIDLAFMDMGLPKYSGQEVFYRMKQLRPDVTVMFATGYLEPDLTSAMMEAGVKEFILKPYDLNSTLRKIRSVLDRKLAK